MTTPPRHFSMIREFHLADFFTLANAACGVGAVFCAMRFLESHMLRLLFHRRCARAGRLRLRRPGRAHRAVAANALGARPGARLARRCHSFGVAPAALGFAAGMHGGWDWIALIYFVCCGVGRLARFNVTAEELSGGSGKVKYFEGTPIPTSVVLTGILAFAAWRGRVGENLYGGASEIGPWSSILSLCCSYSPAP